MNEFITFADCHLDLIWLPPDRVTGKASVAMKARMPYVVDSEEGSFWVSNGGACFGLQNAMGSTGCKYVPGVIHRADVVGR